jgi:Flp pilus assembly protein CpaB
VLVVPPGGEPADGSVGGTSPPSPLPIADANAAAAAATLGLWTDVARDPAGAGPDPDLAGGWPAGQVVTWLPDGRWVSADEAADPDPDLGPVERADPGAAARRRGRRRVSLARLGARLGGWPRRVLVVMLLLTAALLVAVRPHPPVQEAAPVAPTAEVVVAARDLAAGTVLTAADLRLAALPDSVVPAGVVRRPAGLIGQRAAGPVRRGEPVTDVRVVGPGLAAGLAAGETAVPVRLSDAESAALVRPGDRVDVLGTAAEADGTPGTGDAVEVAAAVRVLAVLGSRDAADGVVLVVAATPPTARRLAGAAARHRLSVSVRSP